MNKSAAPKTPLTANAYWFHIFNSMIESGDFARLHGSTIKVYLVIKKHVNYYTGLSLPAHETIAKECGISVPQVKRAIGELERFGYIGKTKRGRKNFYTLREKIPINFSESGKPAAIASWDYMPSTTQQTVRELHDIVIQGCFDKRNSVHIDRIQVNINNISKGGVAINMQETLSKIEPGLRQKLEAMLDRAGISTNESYSQLTSDPCHG